MAARVNAAALASAKPSTVLQRRSHRKKKPQAVSDRKTRMPPPQNSPIPISVPNQRMIDAAEDLERSLGSWFHQTTSHANTHTIKPAKNCLRGSNGTPAAGARNQSKGLKAMPIL